MRLEFEAVYELLLSEGPYKVREVIASAPLPDEDSRLAGLTALVHYWEGEFDAGDYWLRFSETNDVYAVLAKVVKGFTAGESELVAEAEQMLTDALVKEPANALGQMLKAFYLKWDGRRQELEKLANTYPKNIELWNKLGAACLGDGDFGASLSAFEKVCELNPNIAIGFRNIGAIRVARYFSLQSLNLQEDLERAKKAFQRALELEPDNRDFPPLLFLAQIEWGLGNYEDAKKLVAAFLEKNPLSYDALALRIVLQAQTNQTESALELFTQLEQIHPAQKVREKGPTTILGIMLDKRRLAQIIAEQRDANLQSVGAQEDTLETAVQVHFTSKLLPSFSAEEELISQHKAFAEKDKTTSFRAKFGRLFNVTTGAYGYCYLCFTSAALYIVQMGEFTSRKDPYANKSLKQYMGEFVTHVAGELDEMVSFSTDSIFRYLYREIVAAEMISDNKIKILTAISSWELVLSPEVVRPILDSIETGRGVG